MKAEEFQALVTKMVQNADNQALLTELSTQAIDAFKGVATNVDTLTEQVGQHTERINQLKETNMQLFLKAAQPVEQQQLSKPEPLKYEDILKSFGG